ncbi:MAG: putative selenate reductase subunit YgfK [Moorellaceae bacterium]
MGDAMRPIPFRKLLNWVWEEYVRYRSIFGIPQEKFFRKRNGIYWRLFGETIGNVVGPAAGPHTQLAQNIVAAYLCGGRFFELKTVQILDKLELAKPCINAQDEGYNVEWSTELAIEEALEEYVKAWFLLHVLEKELGGSGPRSFVFNMSVGYDLEGIKSPKVDSFIEGLKDASSTKIFQECRTVLKEEIKRFSAVDEEFVDRISPHICNSVTLSTLHGCPPGEIEAICKYLLAEKKLHTFVKLNPTLLGYEFVKNTLSRMGYGYLQLKEESFAHDLQYGDGVELLKRVQTFAEEQQRSFGVKLSNTLPLKITRGELPGEEMYMSGRALYPLTINLAYKLAAEFKGRLKISYAGGADAFNIARIFETGIWPITVATTLLKPGGYLRLKQMAEELEERMHERPEETVNVDKLAELAASVYADTHYGKEARGFKSRKIARTLPLVDCFVAPCIVGCPIGQDVPEYIKLVGEGRYREAYELIIGKNPLPFITGTLCPQFCASKCTRLDYEEPVCIRRLKRIAAEKGYPDYSAQMNSGEIKNPTKVAIIGAGPSGLAAGYFLARSGLEVTIFDQRGEPGGTVKYIIPFFRLSREAIESDLELIKKAGVKFRLGINPEFSVPRLKAEGYKYVYLALGATRSNPLELKTGAEKVISALEFLEQFNKNSEAIRLGRAVAVIGGGDTAMDAARAALRVQGVEKVYLIYRRTKEYMPASLEELKAALEEGVILRELLSPLSWSEGQLRCQKMELGEPDSSGRRAAVPKVGEFEEIPVDTIISAIGQAVDYEILKKNGIQVSEGGKIAVDPATGETNVPNVFVGGDALRGPSTIVQALADGSKVARVILEREGLAPVQGRGNRYGEDAKRRAEIFRKRGVLKGASPEEREEGDRCLECGYICHICVEVCPNRANVAVGRQVLHVDGMCNECGNCATFCPYEGAPYRDKLTLFWSEEDFSYSQNSGFLLWEDGEEPSFKVRLEGKEFTLQFYADGRVKEGHAAEVPGEIVRLLWTAFRDYKYLF